MRLPGRSRTPDAGDRLARLMRQQGELLERSRDVVRQTSEAMRDAAPLLDRVPRRARRVDWQTAATAAAIAVTAAVGVVAYLRWKRRCDETHLSTHPSPDVTPAAQAHDRGDAPARPGARPAAEQATEPAPRSEMAAPGTPAAPPASVSTPPTSVVIASPCAEPEGRGAAEGHPRPHGDARARAGGRLGLPAAAPVFARSRSRAALPATRRRPPFTR